MTQPTAAELIVRWALPLRIEDIPPEVRETGCRHLLDGLGCALAAVRLDAAPYAGAVARAFGPAEATVIGTADRVPEPMAALANGALVHALDFDDTHAGALVHATSIVLPVALAVAERTGESGAEVLTACIAGYEVVARLGAAVPHGLHARGFHATSVCGVFAAALVAAKLMGLDERRTVNALGIAGSLASGSLEFLHTGASTKHLHPGLTGMSGIMAARLAAEGADGPASILEGQYGMLRSYTGADIDAGALTDGFGSRWETTRMTIKPYPVCQLSHASLDALREALVDIGDPSRIEEIEFALPDESILIVCEPSADKRRPRTPYDAKFSLPWCAGVLVRDDEIGIGSFAEPDLGRPQVLALADRTTYRATAFGGVPADAPGEVRIRLDDGSEIAAGVPCSAGGPDRPLTNDEIVAKFTANCGGASPEVSQLASSMLTLDEVAGIGPVIAAACALRSAEVAQ